MKSGADEKEIQKQLKKRDLDMAAAKKKNIESSKVDVKQKKDKKVSIQALKKTTNLLLMLNLKKKADQQ